ncbi:peptidoglycan -binding protein, partial [Ruegeria sp. PrR005]
AANTMIYMGNSKVRTAKSATHLGNAGQSVALKTSTGFKFSVGNTQVFMSEVDGKWLMYSADESGPDTYACDEVSDFTKEIASAMFAAFDQLESAEIAKQAIQVAKEKKRNEVLSQDLNAALTRAGANERNYRSLTEECKKLAEQNSECKSTLQSTLSADPDMLQQSLKAALDTKAEAEAIASEQTNLAELRANLLALSKDALQEEKTKSALLNQQVAALRSQLGTLQALLDVYKSRIEAAQVQVQTLGQDLNAALARAASEERKRRILEEAERARLDAAPVTPAKDAKASGTQVKDLVNYRSEFFGKLRELLTDQEGVRIEGDRLVFSSEVLFDPGSADLSPEGQFEIAKVARILRGVAAEIPSEIDWVIRVDGHTDNVPLSGTGRFADNWELSQGRALSVVRYMVDFLGIAPDRLSANGFGEYQPINPVDTPEARAQNRRIELKLTQK